jgi:release factor glutamine methyltransferase
VYSALRERGVVTNILPGVDHPLVTADGVYVPQQDSQLLIDTLERTTVVTGRHVMDLCTGTGIAAIAAAELGASSVTAWDICPRAVRCAQENAAYRGVAVAVRQGSLLQALRQGPYDVVVSNPPYVPTPHGVDYVALPADVGPARAWDAGEDGRLLLDPLCASAPDLLTAGGNLVLVHSEIAGTDRSLNLLRSGGLSADVVARQSIPFGPVLSARAAWLERTGRLERGRRDEQLVAILARKL